MKLADSPLWSMSDTDTLTRLDLAHHTEMAFAAVKLHFIREVEGRNLPAADKAHNTAIWLGVRLRLKPVTARRLVHLAQALNRRPALDQALTTGAINTEHAVVIHECVDALPTEAGPDAPDQAERLLIDWAPDFDAIGLKLLADRILNYVAPEIADRLEAKALAKHEAAAHEARAFSLSSPVGGRGPDPRQPRRRNRRPRSPVHTANKHHHHHHRRRGPCGSRRVVGSGGRGCREDSTRRRRSQRPSSD